MRIDLARVQSVYLKGAAGAGAPLIAHFAMSGFSYQEPAPVWQKRFYDFNVWTEEKHIEKLVTCTATR